MKKTDWDPQPGDACAIYSARYAGLPDRATATTVERLTKRDVVLANGERFRRDRLERRGPGGPYSAPEYLLPVSDPQVQQAWLDMARSRDKGRVHQAFEDWRLGKTGIGALVQAAEAYRVRWERD